ncbi:MAG: hypothetical protein WCT27_01810 [Patescibacteria group bacterium]|jgi:hypothetical protein
MSKYKYLIGLVIFIAIIFGVLFWQLYNSPTEIQNTTTQDLNAQDQSVPLYISEYNVIIEVVDVWSNGSNELRIINSKTGAVRKTFSAINPSVLHSIIWDQKSSRIYFSSTSINENLTTFFFVDLNDPDPNAISEIVYNSSGFLTGKLEIVGTSTSIIYFNYQGKIYSLDIEKGIDATPQLIR